MTDENCAEPSRRLFRGMIRRFNRSCLAGAVWGFCLSVMGYAMAAGFVWIAFWALSDYLKVASGWLPAAIAAFWGAVTLTGWQRWQAGLAHQGVTESLAFLDLDESQSGAWVVQEHVAQVAGPAFVLSQIFLAGPLQALQAVRLLRSRLPDNQVFEGKLVALLDEVRAKGSWHAVSIWVGREEELSALIRMKKIEFSATKGRMRASTSESSWS